MVFEIFHAIIGHKGMFMKVIKYPYDLFCGNRNRKGEHVI